MTTCVDVAHVSAVEPERGEAERLVEPPSAHVLPGDEQHSRADAPVVEALEPEDRELATEPDAWTDEDNRTAGEHFAYLQAAAADGVLVMAGRSQDGIGPAIVILEVETEADARRFMEGDPFVSSGMFGASLHPFRVALQR